MWADTDLSAARAVFETDGVVKVERAVSEDWVGRLNAWTDHHLEHPSKWVNDNNPGSAVDRLFTDRYLWPDDALIREYALTSGVAELAAIMMGAASAQLYFDHLLVKEPQTEAATPWHQDVPYWPFLGSQITSVWLALTEATVQTSSMEFVRGSHRWNKYFAPEVFGARDDHPSAAWTEGGEGEEMPDIESARHSFDIVGFDVQPGDALVFSAWTVHGAPGNAGEGRRAALSTRWLGDDAVWHPHEGADPTVTQDLVSIGPGQSVRGDENRFPVGWTS